MGNKKGKEKKELFAAFANKEEQRKAAPKTAAKKPANKNANPAAKQPDGKSSTPKSQPPKDSDDPKILQVDEITKASIELIIGAENRGASDDTSERIAALEAKVESMSDDLKRYNDRINKLETKLKQMLRDT